MMATCHARSISLPSISHPLNLSVEEQLDGLRSSQKTSSSVYRKLSGLKILYVCVEDFLQLPLTRQTLSNEQHKERAEEVLSGSLLLRRKGGESSLASEVEAFMISRKQLNKSICKRFRNLKTMDKNASNIPNAIAILTQVWNQPQISTNPSLVQNLLKGLEALESNILEAEVELEAVYRKLLKTRVTILNILSH
ncbi:hypothetical protein DKX38_008660 [Salix brachista]|uniref:Uncharacterized protein n=1 Tax=Salix brachista TaxID=2182728 RepID=A0A5N5MTJ5_9ROSI|nr:hypothetical protein DKX38_008660 [Salix brachista]